MPGAPIDPREKALATRARHPACAAWLIFILGCGGQGPTAEGMALMDAGGTDDSQASPEGTVDAPADAAEASSEAGTTEAADAGGAVSGTVVDFGTFRPLAGRNVSAGGGGTTTDAEGKFTLVGVAGVYDLAVTEPDGSMVSIYRGLSRRDPVLPHERLPPLTTHAADLSGDVSGVGHYPLPAGDFVDVYFFSDQADNKSFISGRSESRGPGYGPIHLGWDGADSISGRLIALGTFGDAGRSFGFFDQPLTLNSGKSAFVNVALTAVAKADHVSGTVRAPENSGIVQKGAFYDLPIAHAKLVLSVTEDTSPEFDCVVPDLTQLGGRLCVSAAASPELAIVQLCGVSPGQTDVLLTPQASPSVLSPSPGATITKDSPFVWTPFEGGVHMLELAPIVLAKRAPTIHVFTAATSMTWPELEPLGVSFPANARYAVAVTGLGPYSTLDEAMGKDGMAAPSPAKLFRSYSSTVYATTAP